MSVASGSPVPFLARLPGSRLTRLRPRYRTGGTFLQEPRSATFPSVQQRFSRF